MKEVVGGDIELNHRVFVLYCTLGRRVDRDSIRVRSSLEHLLVEEKLGRQPRYLGLKVHCGGLGSRGWLEGRHRDDCTGLRDSGWLEGRHRDEMRGGGCRLHLVRHNRVSALATGQFLLVEEAPEHDDDGHHQRSASRQGNTDRMNEFKMCPLVLTNGHLWPHWHLSWWRRIPFAHEVRSEAG